MFVIATGFIYSLYVKFVKQRIVNFQPTVRPPFILIWYEGLQQNSGVCVCVTDFRFGP